MCKCCLGSAGSQDRGGQKAIFCHSWRFPRYISRFAYDWAFFYDVIDVIVCIFLNTFTSLPMTSFFRNLLS
jgi:hypothetical protein